MAIMLIGSGNSPLQPIADYLREQFRTDISTCYAPALALRQLQDAQGALPEMIVADISQQLPPAAQQFLHSLHQAYADVPLLILASGPQAEQADALIKAGAMDVLAKPVPRARLRVAVLNALRMHSLRQEVRRAHLRDQLGDGFSAIVGRSRGMQLALVLARRAALSNAPIWLQGEAGSGKSDLARAIHAESAQRAKPFVPVACGGQSEATLERQMFARAEDGECGTLYLDEVESLSPAFQRRLPSLVLEKGARLIITTRRPVTELLQQAPLLCATLEHMQTMSMALPPLRERREDLPLLAERTLARIAAMEGRSLRGFTATAIAWIVGQPWPGNLPEFVRRIHQAVWRASGEWIEPQHLQPSGPLEIDGTSRGSTYFAAPAGGLLPVLDAQGRVRPLAEVETAMVDFALKHHAGCMARAARALGIGRSTLYRKLQERTAS